MHRPSTATPKLSPFVGALGRATENAVDNQLFDEYFFILSVRLLTFTV
ncbi:MAG TPA: hypothetical protein PKC76_08680 [Saprospiraceae bacterium]|nr:hypothetical protein [Saprospiraceae bacterium]HMP24193.1 hypothetical protein [Saprospiraceae bacterium]